MTPEKMPPATWRVQREPSTPHSTPGALYIDDMFECYTLEDVVREVAGKPVEEWKIYGQTAIPAGVYELILSYSNRFKRELPLVQGVEGFSGVRFHGGNDADDTEGCLLVGQVRVSPDRIRVCAPALDRLIERLRAARVASQRVFCEFRNA